MDAIPATGFNLPNVDNAVLKWWRRSGSKCQDASNTFANRRYLLKMIPQPQRNNMYVLLLFIHNVPHDGAVVMIDHFSSRCTSGAVSAGQISCDISFLFTANCIELVTHLTARTSFYISPIIVVVWKANFCFYCKKEGVIKIDVFINCCGYIITYLHTGKKRRYTCTYLLFFLVEIEFWYKMIIHIAGLLRT